MPTDSTIKSHGLIPIVPNGIKSQPIVLEIKTKENAPVQPVQLFNAINRAFDFDEMEHVNASVECSYVEHGISYKRICRHLLTTTYKIGHIRIVCSKGGFPNMKFRQDGERGFEFVPGFSINIKTMSIFGNIAEINFDALVKKDQIHRNIIDCEQWFRLDADTVFTIENVPPGISFQIYLYPAITASTNVISDIPPITKEPTIKEQIINELTRDYYLVKRPTKG